MSRKKQELKINHKKLNETLDKAIEELERETLQIWKFYERNPEAWLREDPLSQKPRNGS